MPRGFTDGDRGYSSYDSRFPGSHNVDFSRPSTRGGDYTTYDPLSSSGRDRSGYSTRSVQPSSSYDPVSRFPTSTHRDSERYDARRYIAGLGSDDPFSRAMHAENTSSRYGRTDNDADRLPSHNGRGSSGRYGLDSIGENTTSRYTRPTTTSRRDMFPSMDLPSSSSRHGSSSSRAYDFEPTRNYYQQQFGQRSSSARQREIDGFNNTYDDGLSSSRRSSSRHGSSSRYGSSSAKSRFW